MIAPESNSLCLFPRVSFTLVLSRGNGRDSEAGIVNGIDLRISELLSSVLFLLLSGLLIYM